MVIKRRTPVVEKTEPLIVDYLQYRKFLWERQGGTRFVGRAATHDGVSIYKIPGGGDMVYIDPRSNPNFRDVIHTCNKAVAFATTALLCNIGRDVIDEIRMDSTFIHVKFFTKEDSQLDGQYWDDRKGYRGI